MSVKHRVLTLLRSKAWISVEDFEKEFPPKTEGHMSWGQRKRELTSEGYNIIKRRKAGCPNTWEYSLITEPEPSRSEQEEIIAEHNLHAEEKINYKMVGQQVSFII